MAFEDELGVKPPIGIFDPFVIITTTRSSAHMDDEVDECPPDDSFTISTLFRMESFRDGTWSLRVAFNRQQECACQRRWRRDAGPECQIDDCHSKLVLHVDNRAGITRVKRTQNVQ